MRPLPSFIQKFEVWEFCGTGDPMFGGTADDRVLYRLPDGALQFLRRFDAVRLGAKRALFEDQQAAETAGIAASTRLGLISGIESRLDVEE